MKHEINKIQKLMFGGPEVLPLGTRVAPPFRHSPYDSDNKVLALKIKKSIKNMPVLRRLRKRNDNNRLT